MRRRTSWPAALPIQDLEVPAMRVGMQPGRRVRNNAHELVALQFGVFFFCGVDMPDAGAHGTPPQDRRYGQADFLKVYADLEAYAHAAERLGYNSLWLAEHHFQYEGYEVVPNAILMSAFLAGRTSRLQFGRCSTSCRSGIRCASPRTSPWPTS